MTDHEAATAAFASSLDAADVPGRVTDHVGLVVADTVGAIVGGSTDAATTRLVEAAAGGSGTATVLGTDRRLDAARAALANGTAGTVLELDEGHKYAAGHPAIHVLPAVLAEAETTGGDLDAFLAALVAGYEVVTRVARACNPLAPGYHPHGVWGAVGAAAGVSRYRGYDATTTLTAMRLAANHAQQTLMAAATEGATERNTYAGKSNLDGLLAADLAAAGYSALDRGVERHLDRVSADGFDAGRLDEELGTRWEVEGGYFKRHAACRYTHPTLDAVAALQTDGPIDPDEVTDVLVETYPTAAGLTPTHPSNALQAKFSVPFAVATRLRRGESGKAAFEPDALDDETTALAERVRVRVAADVAARVPDARSARVTVRLADGTERTEEVVHARGGAERPWAEPDLREKFESLVRPVLGDDAAVDLWEAARTLSASPGELCAMTRPGGA